MALDPTLSLPDPDGGAGARRNALIGVLLMLAAVILMSAMHAMVRLLGSELHPFEIAFFRNLFGLVAVLPFVARVGLATLRTARPGLHVLRSLAGTVSMLSWFYGLAHVPIAEATALSFIGVVFTSIGAVLVFGEAMGARRWTAVAASFVGALVMLRPGFAEISLGVWMVVFSTVTWSGSLLMVKELGRSDSPTCIVAWMSLLLTFMTALPALAVWQWPDVRQFLFLAAIGASATLGHLLFTRAFQLADATLVMPLDFSRLVWAALLGYLIFREVPDRFAILGGLIIVGSSAYIVLREQRLRRAGRITPATGPRAAAR